MRQSRIPRAEQNERLNAHKRRMFAQDVLASRRQARADVEEVARASLRENPNSGKRKHRVTGTRATGPRMSDRKRTDPRKVLTTYAPGIPSLPPLRTKNIPAGRMRGEVTTP